MSGASPLARAVLDALRSDPAACHELRTLLDIEAPPPAPRQDGWLDTKNAAAYLGLSLDALHKLTAARTIPFAQEAPGCRCWFKRSKLDAWREGGGAGACPLTATHYGP